MMKIYDLSSIINAKYQSFYIYIHKRRIITMSFSKWREISTNSIEEADVCILGIPFDGAASVGKGAALAPEAVRKCTEVLPFEVSP